MGLRDTLLQDAVTYRKSNKKAVIKNPKEMEDMVAEYLEWTERSGKPFTKSGLALYYGISEQALYVYLRKPEFKEVAALIDTIQEQLLIEYGLLGKYNPTLAKLILTSKFKYADKVESKVEGNIEGIKVEIEELKRDK